ncbi:MAG: sigma-54-dependent Fis family transcriptional regulator [Marinobacterium sp.]|nr:sigma-54-dependent Fis family transcriptional regulator [Marinobacterium sp.]
MLEAIADPAALLSADYRILAVNRAYLNYYSHQAPVGQHCYEVSHHYTAPCDLSGELCPLKGCQHSGQRQRVLHLHNTHHGEEHVDVEMIPILNAQQQAGCYLEIIRLVKGACATAQGDGLVGRSAAFNRMLGMIQRAAPSEISVLLLGESGTGKELVAQAVHESSHRANNPFVTVECSGLSEHLFESELFGHERGAFTGAISRKSGLVSAAHGGTLFLDEIGEVPLALQVKLLRLIETGNYRTVGGLELQHADFRLICATHRDLKAMVAEGTFRQDLYYRISTFPILLPRLADRYEDLPLLCEVLLRRIRDGEQYRVSDEAIHYLRHYRFPGNIRELRNLLERAVLLADDGVILPRHLLLEMDGGSLTHTEWTPEDVHTDMAQADMAQADMAQIKGVAGGGASGSVAQPVLHTSFAPQRRPEFESHTPQTLPVRTLAEHEQRYLRQLQRQFRGDNRGLAQQLGISERTLYRKLSQLDKL